jgi:hypothetical protein
MKAVHSSEMSVNICQTARHHIPEASDYSLSIVHFHDTGIDSDIQKVVKSKINSGRVFCYYIQNNLSFYYLSVSGS